jgi:hypothetical protein
MSLWGISTTTETTANGYNIPKHFSNADRNNTPHNAFADPRGWVYRRYGTSEQSGLSINYYDEVIVPIAGLSTGSASDILGAGTGSGLAQPVAIFFEEPGRTTPIGVGAGATVGISTGATGYVHLVFNELVFCSAGATIAVKGYNAVSGTISTNFVATAASFANGSTVFNYLSSAANSIAGSLVKNTSYNGQISNRIAFAFTAPIFGAGGAGSSGIGTVLKVDMTRPVVGVITDASNGVGVVTTFTSDIIRGIGGAGGGVNSLGVANVGLGTTGLTVKA